MKYLLLITSLSVLMISFSCRKKKFINPNDYRTKYLGTYDFKVHDWNFSQGVTIESSHNTFNGSITYYGVYHNKLKIHYNSGGQTYDDVFGAVIYPIVDTAGILTYPIIDQSPHHAYFEGMVTGDSVYFKISSGGMGGQSGQTVTGVRSK